jgi:hypothetical protein
MQVTFNEVFHMQSNFLTNKCNAGDIPPPQALDEIKQYEDGRYLCTHSCIWRLFHYPLHDMFPAVLRLKVHLENEQRITYPASANLVEVVRDAKDTHLTAWMKHNAAAAAKAARSIGPQENDFRTILYMDFCGPCRWDDTRRVWARRSLRSTQIGRMYMVCPREGERYYLRLLLCHVPGATTFNDLRTHDGELHPTFKVT